MKILYAATQNPNKIREIQSLLADKCQVLSVFDLAVTEELPETGNTLEANAMQKARYIYDRFGVNCFADDTGLEVDILNGEPGVYSARYAGPGKDAVANMDLLLLKLEGKTNRSACFKTVIALILDGEEHLFKGVINGNIISEKRGTGGFGYDPVFVPEGHTRTFAEMSIEEKNTISHRAIAVKKMAGFLKDLQG